MKNVTTNQHYISHHLSANDIVDTYRFVRKASAQIAEPLSAEDCAAQSMNEASPIKWHLAHTTWFFETFILNDFAVGYRSFCPEFRYLFNSYYNGVGAQHKRARRGLITRPDLETVFAYREHVDEAIESLLSASACEPEVLRLIELGLHHEQQHQELMFTDVKHLFSNNPLHPAYNSRWPLTEVHPAPMSWIRHEGGLVEIGAHGGEFTFDNELPRHPVYLQPFELADRLVTNEEYIQFIEDGGYRRPELWLSDGWEKSCSSGWQAPEYWRRDDNTWRCFTLHGECAIDPFAPVCHVSYFEADAFARWSGARLPDEKEWEFAASGAPISGNFMETGVYHPLALRQSAPDGILSQLFGDVWEWTMSPYAPYPGYSPPAGAIGEYNAKFMNGQYVLRGGSCVSPEKHIRSSYRNFFPPSARWQFAGIRLARDAFRNKGGERQHRSHKVKVLRHQPAEQNNRTADNDRAELITTLTAARPSLPPKYFYDLLGSHLFEAITKTGEYYLTRAEAEIFDTFAEEIAQLTRSALGPEFQMVDIGAGNCEKAASLLPIFKPSRYVPVDISDEFLHAAAISLAERFDGLSITAVAMDFSDRFSLPAELASRATLFFYPGSSLGNFSPDDAQQLLAEIAAATENGALLIGVDLQKDKNVLEAAYADNLGVTSIFNLNTLNNVNAILGSNFNIHQWSHRARYDEQASRIEMHLVAKEELTVAWPGGERRFASGEHIVTEHSYKWNAKSITALVNKTGFNVQKIWTDKLAQFVVVFAIKKW